VTDVGLCLLQNGEDMLPSTCAKSCFAIGLSFRSTCSAVWWVSRYRGSGDLQYRQRKARAGCIHRGALL